MPSKKVFTVAASAPFLETFVSALLNGTVIQGFSRACTPLELADATIYVPTRRAARALADQFARAFARPATLLPRILPLGGLEATETSLIFDGPGVDTLAEDIPQAASDIWRRMRLAQLIQHWATALRHAIVSIGKDGTPVTDPSEGCLVGTSAADAWHLAGELGDLIDEMTIEDVAWERLDPLVLPEFDHYWRITLDFLTIAMKEWPRVLAENNLIDAARRQVLLAEAQIARIKAGCVKGPIIAIGSTGTNRATARLLAAIAEAPQGAVVLPGLELELDEDAWQRIGDGDHADESSFGHPQAALRRLLPILGVTRKDVRELGKPSPVLTARDQLISEALRPADATDHWHAYRATVASADVEIALDGVTLIEAIDEREEALALAIALRQALETPEATAALVTPDRDLARRVAAELARFGIEIDDSAGEPLSASLYATLAQIALRAATNGLAPADLTALLTHPAARFGCARSDLERMAPLFEIGLLRQDRHLSAFATPAEAIAAARRACESRFAHSAQKRISDAEWTELEDLLARIKTALAPLTALSESYDLRRWIDAHRQALIHVTQGEGPEPRGEDVETFEALLIELRRCALPDLRFDAEGYGLFLAQTTATMTLRRARRTHPRLKIFGLLEARLMPADVILLGGLDEAIWPPQAKGDAFLNRPMRRALGLTPPERKIGQTAHDFVEAMGHKQVILSRALKRDGAPTVASRFVQRLAAVAGETFEACRARGQNFIALARALDAASEATSTITRPMPRPPLELRPQRLSVTRIETLRRDPYAIYAEFILKLKELPRPAESGDRRIMGTIIHAVLAEFAMAFPANPLPRDASRELMRLMQAAFAEERDDPDFAAFTWPRIARAIDFYLDFETRRRATLIKIDAETADKIEIPLADGTVFTLSAKADRIEHHADGSVALIDYKTGILPGTKEVRVGFVPQLTLEAAMATRGAFGLAKGARVEEAIYLKLMGKQGGEERPLSFTNPSLSVAELAEVHLARLIELLDQFRDPATPYPPRPYPKFAARFSAYDHLARVKEWSSGRDTGAAT